MHLIDRRLNGRNKSAVNRERFIRRYKDHIRRAVKGMVADRSIKDMVKGGEVKVPAKDISEPAFRYGQGGDWESVHPGNREFVKGDRIQRPNGGGGSGGSEPGTGESTDEFVFTLSRDEFLNIFFEDLELPNLMRTTLAEAQHKKLVRAGYVKDGSPSNLSVARTMKTALARRIALSGPLREELEELKALLADLLRQPTEHGRIQLLHREVEELEARLKRVPFLDDVDLRYRHRIVQPAPVARAVMFCLMDVSASMDERKKDLAKRFFTLLYLFLTRKYETVNLVFIRHTDEAEEVDEDTFFYDQRSGGTVVLSALEMMKKVVDDRFPLADWNIYAAQASDGDAFGADAGKSARFLRDELLPLTRYFAYIETPEEEYSRKSPLWAEYEELQGSQENFAMKRVSRPQDIYPVFRDLFAKETVS
jgi:uncharacterized sporulation protein YeaH/YhbH (DUF444 family)